MIALLIVLAVFAYGVAAINEATLPPYRRIIFRPRRPRHRHHFRRVGYGGAGWSLYRCDCGATEIDA